MIYKKVPLDAENENIFLECFVAEKLPYFTRKAILVIPGGGYGCVCADREGEPIALAFLPHGFNAFVLHYSVRSNSDKVFPTQLIEASKAIKYIRDNAEEFGIDKDAVFATGFSAGGHLCASLGILWNNRPHHPIPKRNLDRPDRDVSPTHCATPFWPQRRAGEASCSPS